MRFKTADGYIEALYLPKNTTALIQPMDQNVIKTLKAHYKKRLLIDIVSQPDADITSILKNFNIKDAIVNAAYAWCQVKPLTLIKSWENIWPENPLLPKKDNRDNKSESDNNEVTKAALTLCDEINIPQEDAEELRRWVLDDNLGSELTEEEINQEVTAHVVDDDPIEAATEVKSTITCDEVMAAANTLVRWCEERELDYENILMLKQIQEKAMTDSLRKKKQKTITDFLKR